MIKPRKTQTKQQEFNPFESHTNTAQLINELDLIDKKCITTRFKATSDPIHMAFETIENTSLKNLAKDFVKESLLDFAEFITRICK